MSLWAHNKAVKKCVADALAKPLKDRVSRSRIGQKTPGG
jgi:hypothetical protein